MLNDMYVILKGMIDEERLKHSIGVQETAISLAKRYGVDSYKASIAGLIHDCAKEFSDKKLYEIAKEQGIEIDYIYKSQPGLLHGPVGAKIAFEFFSIDDGEILHSIKCHTTACENMSMLDKIIYIADYIEPGRNFQGVDELRKTAYSDIDKAVLMALDATIKLIIERGQLIDINTIKARNFMIANVFL